MSDITISVIPPTSTIINVGVDETTLIETAGGLLPHAATHISGGNDEINHNSLIGLQGGSNNEYYHISSEQYTNLTTGDVIRPSQTGLFYPTTNPSGYITGVNNVVYTILDQTINGTKNFITRPTVNGTGVLLSGEINAGVDSSQVVMLTGNQTISGTKSFVTRPRVGGVNVALVSEINNLVYTTGSQTINGQKTFATGIVVESASNQIILKTGSAGNSIFINVPTINANYTYTLPDVGSSAAFVLTQGPQTIDGTKTFSIRPTVNGTGVVLTSEINNLVYITGDQFISGIKIFGQQNNILTGNNSHILGGIFNQISGNDSFVGGGRLNSTEGTTTVVVGGLSNSVKSNYASILGGQSNFSSGNHSCVVAGRFNTGNSNFSFIGGGNGNYSAIPANNSVIGGGESNAIANSWSAICGGRTNGISGRNGFIGGGWNNKITAFYAVIGGGVDNIVDDAYSSIVGGQNNIIYQINGKSFIGGGSNNTIGTTTYSLANNSVIVGGSNNSARANHVFIGGGNNNGIFGASSQYSFIGGGYNNAINDSDYSVICGGDNNEIYDSYAAIFNGSYNIANNDNSFILNGDHNQINGLGSKNTIFNGSYNKTHQVSKSFIGFGDNNLISGYNVDYPEYVENIIIPNCSILNGNYNKIFRENSAILNASNSITSGQKSTIVCGDRVLIPNGESGAVVIADSEDRDHYSKGQNTCSLDFINGVYLRLPSFTGSKDQAGNLGELKVSGEYLYIATGQDTWGRIQISTF